MNFDITDFNHMTLLVKVKVEYIIFIFSIIMSLIRGYFVPL